MMITFTLANYYYFSFFLRSSRTVSPVVQIKLGAILQLNVSRRTPTFTSSMSWLPRACSLTNSSSAVPPVYLSNRRSNRSSARLSDQVSADDLPAHSALPVNNSIFADWPSELDTWIHHHLCRHRPHPPHTQQKQWQSAGGKINRRPIS